MRDAESVAETVRKACLAAGQAAFEDAGIRGLCLEGQIEAAFDAIRTLDLTRLAAPAPLEGPSSEHGVHSAGG